MDKAAQFALAMREFSHQGYTLDDMPDSIPDGWQDSSWHNDICPKLRLDVGDKQIDYCIWIECADKERREFPEVARYIINVYDWNGNTDGVTLLETDSWPEVLAYVATMKESGNV